MVLQLEDRLFMHLYFNCLHRLEEEVRSPEAGLQVVVNCLTWILGIELRSCARTVHSCRCAEPSL